MSLAVEDHLGTRVSRATGLLRLALDDEQAAALRSAPSASEEHVRSPPTHTQERSDALAQRWLSADEAKAISGGDARGGVFAPSAVCVDVPRYLEGLWSACEEMGGSACRWHLRGVESLAELADGPGRAYDAVVVTAGAGCTDIAELTEAPT